MLIKLLIEVFCLQPRYSLHPLRFTWSQNVLYSPTFACYARRPLENFAHFRYQPTSKNSHCFHQTSDEYLHFWNPGNVNNTNYVDGRLDRFRILRWPGIYRLYRISKANISPFFSGGCKKEKYIKPTTLYLDLSWPNRILCGRISKISFSSHVKMYSSWTS